MRPSPWLISAGTVAKKTIEVKAVTGKGRGIRSKTAAADEAGRERFSMSLPLQAAAV